MTQRDSLDFTSIPNPCYRLRVGSARRTRCASGGMADALASGASVPWDVEVQLLSRAQLHVSPITSRNSRSEIIWPGIFAFCVDLLFTETSTIDLGAQAHLGTSLSTKGTGPCARTSCQVIGEAILGADTPQPHQRTNQCQQTEYSHPTQDPVMWDRQVKRVGHSVREDHGSYSYEACKKSAGRHQ